MLRVWHAAHAQVWDLGGQANLRPSWATYYRSTDAVIIVVDSTDRARASIAKVRASTPGQLHWHARYPGRSIRNAWYM